MKRKRMFSSSDWIWFWFVAACWSGMFLYSHQKGAVDYHRTLSIHGTSIENR